MKLFVLIVAFLLQASDSKCTGNDGCVGDVKGICLAGACVACRRNRDCTDVNASKCDSDIKACVACEEAVDCKHFTGVRNCSSGICNLESASTSTTTSPSTTAAPATAVSTSTRSATTISTATPTTPTTTTTTPPTTTTTTTTTSTAQSAQSMHPVPTDERSIKFNPEATNNVQLLKCDCVYVTGKDLSLLSKIWLEDNSTSHTVSNPLTEMRDRGVPIVENSAESITEGEKDGASNSFRNCADNVTCCRAEISRTEDNGVLSLSSLESDEAVDMQSFTRFNFWQEIKHSVKLAVKVRGELLENDFKEAVSRAISQTIRSRIEVSEWEMDNNIINLTVERRRLEEWRSNNIVIDYVTSVVNRARDELTHFMRGIQYDEKVLDHLSKVFEEEEKSKYEVTRVERSNPTLGRLFLRPLDTTTTPPPCEHTSTTTTHGAAHSAGTHPLPEDDCTNLLIIIGTVAGLAALCLFSWWWFKCPCTRASRQDKVRDLEKQELKFTRPAPSRAPVKTQESAEWRSNGWDRSEDAVEQQKISWSRLLSRGRVARSQTASIASPFPKKRAAATSKQPSVNDVTRSTDAPPVCTTLGKKTNTMHVSGNTTRGDFQPSGNARAQARTPWPRDADKDAVAERIGRHTHKEPELRFEASPYKLQRQVIIHDHGSLGDKSCYLCEYNRDNGLHSGTQCQLPQKQAFSRDDCQSAKTYRR